MKKRTKKKANAEEVKEAELLLKDSLERVVKINELLEQYEEEVNQERVEESSPMTEKEVETKIEEIKSLSEEASNKINEICKQSETDQIFSNILAESEKLHKPKEPEPPTKKEILRDFIKKYIFNPVREALDFFSGLWKKEEVYYRIHWNNNLPVVISGLSVASGFSKEDCLKNFREIIESRKNSGKYLPENPEKHIKIIKVIEREL